MHAVALDSLPGFRRRFVIAPAAGSVRCALEDDFHCMELVLRHDGVVATAVEPVLHRAPWSTCPGAPEQARQTFTGLPLAAFPVCGGKRSNCTHLFDLALLAANHAFDAGPTVYDLLVSDPVAGGERRAELRRDGRRVLAWTAVDMRLVAPAALAGKALADLGGWIASLPPQGQEEARLLRWATMMANGRTIPLAQQSDATRMPPGCYTFQPERAAVARRVGESRDFSAGAAPPLAHVKFVFSTPDVG